MIKYKYVVGVTFLTLFSVLLFFINSSKAAFLSGSGDNLGDHSATSNIKLNTFWLSGDGGDEGIYINSVGNVGIGTLAPFQKLHSTFFIRADSGFCIGTECITSWPSGGLGDNLGNHIATQNLKMSGFWLSNDGGDEGLYINSVGNVGVGIINPGVKLEVAKSAREGTLNSNSALDVVGNAITSRVNNTVQDIFRLHQPNTVVDSKGSTFAIGLSFPDDPGNNYPRTRVDFKTTDRTTDNANAAKIVMSLMDSGNVGIGTTAPSQALQVVGSVQATSFIGSLSGNAITATSLAANGANCSAGYYPLGVNASGVVETCTLAGAGSNWTLNGTHIYNSNSGNVGIGTTTPVSILHIKKDQSATTELIVENVNTGTAAIARLSFKNATSGNDALSLGIFGTGFTTIGGYLQDGAYLFSENLLTGGLSIGTREASANLRFYTAGQADVNERMRITSTGNVGIGTTIPTQKFHVAGASYLNGQITTALSGAGNRCAYVDSVGNLLAKTTDCGTATGGDNLGDHIATQNIRLGSYWLSGDGGSEGIFVTANGNVGIGTTAPSQALQVVGSVQATSFIGSLSGNAITATSLAANGANCSAGYYPLGVNASGAVETCTLVSTASDIYWTGTATNLDAATGRSSLGLGSLATLNSVTSAYITDSTIANIDISPSAAIAATKIQYGDFFINSAGTNGQVWTSDGAGAGTWTAVSGGSDIYWTGTATNLNAATGRASLGLGSLATLNSVTSAYITDSTIANIDISPSAAIAATKIQYGDFFINSAGTNGQVWTSDGAGAGTWTASTGLPAGGSAGNTIYYNGSSWVSDMNLYNNGGNVGIGTSAPVYKLEVVGTSGIAAAAFVYNSDRNLKSDIKQLDNALEKIMALDGVSFKWKANGSSSVGLIAQDVEKVFPELVTGEEGRKGVQYGNLVAPLIEAIKEQQAQIDDLQKRIVELENVKK